MKFHHNSLTTRLLLLLNVSGLNLLAAPTYRVFGTREGLVGGTTANGHVITSRDHFVALPSDTVLNTLGGRTYTVTISNPRNGLSVTEPVWDIGPWNTKDNYWHTPRAEFSGLPLGKPEAQAAYYEGYNGGKDEFGRTVLNGAGIDLADGTFWDSLGMTENDWVDVTYNWESGGGSVPARIDVFQRGLDNACWHKSNQDGVGWSGWSSMGGSMASDPASVSRKYNSINVVARVGDNSIWHISWDGSVWSSWTSLGGSLIGSPDLSSKDQNNVEVFARGSDSAMWHKWWNGSVWSSWATLGGSLASDPGASSRGNGLVDVYSRVADNSVWHNSFFGGSWSGWTSMAGSVIGGPDAASKNINQEEIFVRGADSSLYHKWWDGTAWSGWASLGGSINSDPGAVAKGGNWMEVFAKVGDNSCWRIYFNGSWSSWSTMGGTFSSGPDAASWSNTHP